ncbi:MAG: arsenite methyltransferase [Deltaproteobacteria bacterium]|nr:arsenite methyltransferase [Deltaproteobacteria bacterium]
MLQGEIKKVVRDNYGRIAETSGSCCGSRSSCCGGGAVAEDISRKIGYSTEEMEAVPEGANLGLGCGNPVALATLKEGETVIDLGSGAGFDSFLAAQRVGKTGQVIGVDMTPQMLDRARENAAKGNYDQVEFRLGEIENLPVADNTADIIISNCVINLSPDKERVFQEAYRVLKPGGRIMVSDMVLLAELPDALRNSIQAYIGCIAGAVMKADYLDAVAKAGFQDVKIIDESIFFVNEFVGHPAVKEAASDPGMMKDKVETFSAAVASIKVYAVKPL